MVTTLTRLVDLIERGTVPTWLRNEIVAKKDEIAAALQAGKEITLEHGDERVTIRSEKQVAAA
jgi:hypothetical protein